MFSCFSVLTDTYSQKEEQALIKHNERATRSHLTRLFVLVNSCSQYDKPLASLLTSWFAASSALLFIHKSFDVVIHSRISK